MNAIGPHRQQCLPLLLVHRIGLFLLLIFVGETLSAQDHLRIESTKGSHLTIRPGSLITIPLRTHNTGLRPDQVTVIPALPRGWRQLTRIPEASIGPGESAIRLITLSPPQSVTAGPYRVDLSVVDSSHSGVQHLTITVDVERLVAFELVQLDAPRFSVGGDAMTFDYEVTNSGNDLLSLTVEARSTQNFPVSVDPPLLQIPVGTAARFTATVHSPADLARKERHGLIVTVIPTSEGESRSLTTLSDVLPKVASTRPDVLEYPLSAALRVAGDNRQHGVQAEVSGFGSTREDNSDKFEFLVRTPETQSLSVLGVRDEYRVRYARNQTQVYAGDWNYALTTLTEVGRYAFGVGGESVLRDVTVGGFVNTTRIGSPTRRQAAGYARYEVNSTTRAGLNVLHRSEETKATIVSSSLQLSLFQRSLLDLEAGLSSGPASNGGALSARLNGSLPIGQYDIRYVNAGKDFASYYRDVQLVSASLSGYATRDIRLDILARDERRNARLDTVVGYSPRSQFIQIGGGYSSLLSVYYRASLLSDPLSPSRPDKREDLVQFRISQRLSIVNVAAYVDLGTLTDRATASSGPSSRYAVNLSAQPLPRQSYSANVELARSPDLASGLTSERLSGSVTAVYLITDDTRGQVSYFTSRTSSPFVQRYSILDASLDHTFPSHHRVGARARSTSLTGSATEIAYAVEYGMPVALPLGTVTSSGVVSGRLLDQNGNGIGGVYITAGTKAAVSDANGLFAIRGMAPGSYALNVDRGTLGLDRILNVPLPYQIQVIGGEESSVVLRALQPGILQGTTQLFNAVPTGIRDSVQIEEVPPDGRVSLVVDITNGEERFRRRANKKGVFVFTDLRPGTWRVRFSAIDLPDDHIFEPEETTVEIASGASTLVTVKVVPRQRRIRVLQEGGVLKPKQ